MNTELISQRTQVVDAQGRNRGFKVWVICPHCGKGRWTREDTVRRNCFTGFCIKCHTKYTTGKMAEHSQWKGGRTTKNGYIYVRLTPDDPFFPMARTCGYIREHRLVMARFLGRLLTATEIVHHRNGKPDDNRLENLEIISPGVYHILDGNANAQIKRLRNHIKKLKGSSWDRPRKTK